MKFKPTKILIVRINPLRRRIFFVTQSAKYTDLYFCKHFEGWKGLQAAIICVNKAPSPSLCPQICFVGSGQWMISQFSIITKSVDVKQSSHICQECSKCENRRPRWYRDKTSSCCDLSASYILSGEILYLLHYPKFRVSLCFWNIQKAYLSSTFAHWPYQELITNMKKQ